MTKSKKAFNEVFGDLTEQQNNVKRRVHAQLQQQKRPARKRTLFVAAAALTFLALTGGTLWWTMQEDPTAEQAAQMSNVPLQEDIYMMNVYGARYFSPNVATEAEAKKRVFDAYVEQQAIILYAEQQQLHVSPQEAEQLVHDELARFSAHPHTAQAQYYREMRDHFNLDEQQYGEKLLQQPLIAKYYEALFLQKLGLDATKDAGHAELQRIRQQALALYEQQYAPQLQQFKQQHNISDQPTRTFTDVQMLDTVFGTYAIANVGGNDVFAGTNELTVGWTVGEAVGVDAFLNELYAFGSRDTPFVFFSLHTLPQYVALAKQYKEQHPEAAQQVDDFVRLMDIFEQTARMD